MTIKAEVLQVCFPVTPSLLQLDPSLLADLERALAGRPRQRDLVEAEVDDMLGGEGGGEMIGASAAGLLEDDDDELLDDEVGGRSTGAPPGRGAIPTDSTRLAERNGGCKNGSPARVSSVEL